MALVIGLKNPGRRTERSICMYVFHENHAQGEQLLEKWAREQISFSSY